MIENTEDIIGDLKEIPLFFLLSSLHIDMDIMSIFSPSIRYPVTLNSRSWISKPPVTLDGLNYATYGCADQDKGVKFSRFYYIDDTANPGVLPEYIEMVCKLFNVEYTLTKFTKHENMYFLYMKTSSIYFTKSYGLYHMIRHAVSRSGTSKNNFALFFVKIHKQKPFENLTDLMSLFIKISQVISVNSTFTPTHSGYYFQYLGNNTSSYGFYYNMKNPLNFETELNKTSVNSFKDFIGSRFRLMRKKELCDNLWKDSYSFLFEDKSKEEFNGKEILKQVSKNFESKTLEKKINSFAFLHFNEDILVETDGVVTFSNNLQKKQLKKIYELYNRN